MKEKGWTELGCNSVVTTNISCTSLVELTIRYRTNRTKWIYSVLTNDSFHFQWFWTWFRYTIYIDWSNSQTRMQGYSFTNGLLQRQIESPRSHHWSISLLDGWKVWFLKWRSLNTMLSIGQPFFDLLKRVKIVG